MYQFSRGMYRELAALVDPVQGPGACLEVLQACERTIERLATDRDYFARPTRTLFLEIRRFFAMRDQRQVLAIISGYVACTERWLDEQPKHGLDVNGQPLMCKATTRRGTQCQRTPLPHNGYCPSHQHLAESEAGAVIADLIHAA